MKKVNLIIVFAVLMFSAASAQKKSSKEISKAVEAAESIAFELDSAGIKSLEKPAYIYFTQNSSTSFAQNARYDQIGQSELKKVLDGNMIYANSINSAGYIVSSGTISFLVQEIDKDQAVWVAKKKFKNGVTPVSFDLEEGKYYNLRFKNGKKGAVDFFIEKWKDEDVDMLKRLGKDPKFDLKSQIETKNAFAAYTAEHPNRFDGTWTGKGGSLWAKYSSIQYVFDGNKMKYEVSTKQYGGLALVVEGRILYNDEILVLLPEKVFDETGVEVNYISMLPYVCYYTITGNELNLEHGNRSFLFGLWRTGGKYTKTE
jgi:hypothetical protein